MHFPYGLSDFNTLRQEGYWYLDRTDRIPALEAAGRQLIFLRPRRFGKSLLLSMLEQYYDLNKADQFAALFGSLAIGRNPTPLHNQYFVLRWDFSLVAAHGEIADIEGSLHRHLNARIAAFARRYRTRRCAAMTWCWCRSWRGACMWSACARIGCRQRTRARPTRVPPSSSICAPIRRRCAI
jgi:hypothetical protein